MESVAAGEISGADEDPQSQELSVSLADLAATADCLLEAVRRFSPSA